MGNLILVGHGGSGKDHFRKVLEKRGHLFAVTHTSRPKRDGEVDGVDCHFVEPGYFRELINQKQMQEWDVFNGWYYGTTKFTWEYANVFIMTPRGIAQLSPIDREKSTVIFIDIPQDIRRKRMEKRKNADDVGRRLVADTQDFAHFKNYDIRITNPLF